jgi:hypothetical protein
MDKFDPNNIPPSWHDERVKFYKYCSPEASLAILENQSLKWSNPNEFNDPFDFPTEMDYNFDGDQLTAALTEEMVRLVYCGAQIEFEEITPLAKIVIHETEHNTRELVFRKKLQDIMPHIAHNFDKGKVTIRSNFKEYREKSSVFCVSKTKNNLLMWAHYAKDHTGCTFKFKCIPKENRPLCIAQKVEYYEEYPVIASLKDKVKHLTGQKIIDNDSIFNKFILAKSSHWQYEEEWRVVKPVGCPAEGYCYESFIPEELEAIYLGCKIDPEVLKKIKGFIQKKFKNIKLYQAYTDTQSYGLNFKKISIEF